MRHVMLLLGLGTALLAAGCAAEPALPLALVAARNAVGTLQQLLAMHEPDERDEHGLTPLMWAARSGAVDAMRVLLDRGADPNARDRRNGWTPLLHAIHKRQAGAVRLLLARGADPNGKAGELAPLLMAASDADPTIAELLLQSGADVHVRGVGGSTPLSQAVSGGALSDIDRPLLGGCHAATVRALLAHEPGLRLPGTIAGHTALWWAKFHECEEVIRLVTREG